MTLSFPDGVGNQIWTYTPDGLPLTIRTYNNSTGGEIVDNAYVYNRRRLLTGETSAQPGAYSWSVGYGYDANGSLASMVYPSTLTITYAPNALGQPTQAGTFATGVQYFPNGAVKQFTYGSGIVHTMTQNARLLPASSVDSGGVLDLTFAYDANGNTLKIDNHRTVTVDEDRTMVYDALDRLTSAQAAIFGGDHVHRFTYDVQDNLRSWTLAGVKDYASYEYTNNQLTAIKNSVDAVVDAFSYDPQGNLDERRLNLPGEQDFSFDFGNRNRGIAGLEGFRYDGHGRRVSTWLPAQGKARFYMYGRSGQLFFEGSETQGINSEFVYLGDELIAAKEVPSGGGTRVRYKHTDALGSPVATTDEVGVVVDRTNYEPFGKTIGENLDGVGFTGHVMESQSGLIYMHQRYFDPSIGRFLSVDPVLASTVSGVLFNRYSYGLNNPYRFVDIDGRAPCPAGQARQCAFSKYVRTSLVDTDDSGGGGASSGEQEPPYEAKRRNIQGRFPSLTSEVTAAAFNRLSEDNPRSANVARSEISSVSMDRTGDGVISVSDSVSGTRDTVKWSFSELDRPYLRAFNHTHGAGGDWTYQYFSPEDMKAAATHHVPVFMSNPQGDFRVYVEGMPSGGRIGGGSTIRLPSVISQGELLCANCIPVE